MLVPVSITLSLCAALSTALPLSSYSSSSTTDLDLELDLAAGSWRYPSFLPQADPTLVKRSVALDFGDEGIVVLDTANDANDGSLTKNSSLRDDNDDVFDPSAWQDANKIVKNPKVVPNPKNPNFSSYVAAQASATSTSEIVTTSTTVATPSPTSGGSSTFKGEATYFFQGGQAGACGNVNPDSAYIVALDYRLYGNVDAVSKYCGKSLTIKNTDNGKTVVATVADACPTCSSKYSLDLSEGAFGQIGDYDTGILPIEWWWN
ncbi:RlpA-like double-psi beta-barrel domain-containing protein [Sporobolomyces koalae]|uniref:RlpA-like double-psi beta-barrel domain-containing protein n=1 Tax=Sporobolomyces koalae TaxID=500713 RepID=UPI0031747096